MDIDIINAYVRKTERVNTIEGIVIMLNKIDVSGCSGEEFKGILITALKTMKEKIKTEPLENFA